ncbi:MAG: leucyl/phenylalanyl-tRNA--protein transferase [Bacteroidetes bacterium]|nr:leucyl/phenylalanyl-tRNA--protein transferase [Bacteroidota bacterium]
MSAIPAYDLLSMYAAGIFPMAEGRGGPIMLFSPDPRTILDPARLHLTKSLRKTVSAGRFEIRINGDFERVMRHCADREDTWISEDIIASYVALYELGYAHSVEAWKEGEMAGGLYGVSIGAAFFGESMFFLQRDASKVALAALCQRMIDRGMTLLDVQYTTPHLQRLGAEEISREEYLKRLDKALKLPVSFID